MVSEVKFYKEENFRVVEADGFKIEIPKEWEVVRLENVVEIYDSKRIPLSEQERAARKGHYPYCGATGVIDYIDDYIFEGEYVLLAEDGGYFGSFEQSAYIMNGKFWVNNHAHVLKAINDFANNWYLMYTLNYLNLKPYIVGSTRTKLNQSDMRRIKIPLPPLPEQQKIAHVLMSIDRAIEAVDEAIKQAERIKKGLMQELLTKGIRHTEFRDTEIGKLPKEWEVVRLGKVVKDILTGATPLRSNKEYWLNGDIPWLTNEEVEDGKINYIWDTKEKVTEKALKETNIKLIPENSVILSLTASVGKVAINKIPITTNQQFNSFIIDSNKIHPEFLGHYFIFAKKRIELLAGTTTFKFISKSKIANFLIPLPPLPEQHKIVEILSKWDEVVEIKKAKKERLERMKKKVMDLLLTGKVRIK